MKSARSRFLTVALGVLLLIPAAQAHRLWLLPSTTVLSGEAQVVSVEGAISNDLFYPNHVALPLDASSAIAPSGKPVELINGTQGKIRCSFELRLPEQGSYRITTINDMMFVRWKEDGEMHYARGYPADIAAMDLTGREELGVSNWISRVETFVTCGAPTALPPTGKGIELAFITHPNDLYAGETATFRVLLDGEPLPHAEVEVVKGDDRFRDTVDEINLTSDESGLIEITWDAPGRYWLTTSAPQAPGEFKGHPLQRGTAYFLTLEVLPE